jgi:hypothetical protein
LTPLQTAPAVHHRILRCHSLPSDLLHATPPRLQIVSPNAASRQRRRPRQPRQPRQVAENFRVG